MMRAPVLAVATITLLLLTACTADDSAKSGDPAPSADADGALAGEWRLIEGSDARGEFALKDSLVTLTLVGQTTGGRTPCNVFGAKVTAPPTGNGPITITPTFQTEVACADPELMAIEPRYLAALDAVTEAAASGDSLVLTDPTADVTLTFEAIPAIPTAQLVGTEWLLESLTSGGADGFSTTVLGNGYLVFAADSTVIGNTGCSNFTGLWENTGGEITISELTLQDTDCPDGLLSQQNHLATVLGGSFSAEIVGGTLTVTAPDSGLGATYRSGALGES